MNAKEARKKTIDFNTINKKGQYSRILKQIKENQEDGDTNLIWYERLKEGVREHLISEGYTIKEAMHFQAGEVPMIIRW